MYYVPGSILDEHKRNEQQKKNMDSILRELYIFEKETNVKHP